jgi:hypothetical protein
MSDFSRQLDRPTTQPTWERDVLSIEVKRVSWGAVLSGVVVALVVQLLLNLLGVGVGVATLDPGMADNPSAGAFSIAAGLWYLGAGVIAAFAGGYIAGRLFGGPDRTTSALHGLTSWAVTTLVVVMLLTTAVGSIIGGVFSGVSGAIGGVGQSALSAVQVAAPRFAAAADPFGAIEAQLREGGNDPAALRDAAIASVRAALTGEEAQAKEARERAVEAVARAQNIPPDEAQKKFAQYEQQYRQAVDQGKQQAIEAAKTTTKVVSRGALFSFFALVFGALAAWFGGRLGTVMSPLTSPDISPASQRGS